MGLASQFFFDLASSAVLPVHQVHLTLLSGLLLLRLDHGLHVTSTHLLLSALLVVPLSGGLLLGFSLERDLLLSLMGGHLAISDLLVGLFFHLTVHLAFHGLIHLLLALAVLLLLQGHDVALALGDDLRSALACLVDLLDDLALFHLEEPNTVAEQLQILLGPFAGDFGSTELLVQRVIVVLFIRGQVHLIVLDVLHFVTVTWGVLAWAVHLALILLSILTLVVMVVLLVVVHID